MGLFDRGLDDVEHAVGEPRLGETEDPRELVHGDVSAIRAASASLLKFASAFGEMSDRLGQIETAVDAFLFSPEPGRWATAAQAMAQASASLRSYAQAVEAAQAQARQAVELWAQGPREEARRLLAAARRARDEAASDAASVVNRAKDLAPAEPSFPDRTGGVGQAAGGDQGRRPEG